MGIKEIEVGGKIYKYDDDVSWEKWKDILSMKHNSVDIADWYAENVLITKPFGFKEMLYVVDALQNHLGHSEDELFELVKKSGKLGRGRGIPEMNKDAIEYSVLKGMNGGVTYSELEKIPYRKIIFFCKLLEEESKKIEEDIKDAKRNAKNSGNNRRGRR